MPGILEAANVHQLIERSKAGESLKDIARSVGCCDRTVMEAMHRAGFRYMEHRRAERMRLAEEVFAAHTAGESILAISKRIGMSRKCITRWIERAGHRQRGMSEAQRVRMAATPPEVRKQHAAAAHAARRGKPMRDEEKIRRAASRSRRIGVFERETIEHLNKLGVAAEGQYPIGPYNVDVWLHEYRVAVEIYSAHPSRKLMAHIHKRSEYILDQGIHLLVVQINYPNRVFNLAAVCDKVISFAQFTRRNQAAIGHHGMVRGNGQVATTSSHQLDGRTLVAGF